MHLQSITIVHYLLFCLEYVLLHQKKQFVRLTKKTQLMNASEVRTLVFAVLWNSRFSYALFSIGNFNLQLCMVLWFS